LIRIAAGAALALGIVASALPVEAACPIPANTINSFPSQIYTPVPGGGLFHDTAVPGVYPTGFNTSSNLKGAFWSLNALPGGGNPAVGVGNDSGINSGIAIYSYPHDPSGPGANSDNWLYNGYYSFIGGGLSNWEYVGTDGCIAADGTVGVPFPALLSRFSVHPQSPCRSSS
jgi:hypothetical protein